MKTVDPKAQLAKLPKWARDYIEHLDRKVDELQDENTQLRGEKQYTGTRVFIRNYGGKGDIPLPPMARILFRTGEHTTDYIEVGFNHERDLSGLSNHPFAVQVHCGNGAAVVVPSARNAIHVIQSYDI